MGKKKIVRYLGIALLVIIGILVFLAITGTVAHAAGLVDDTVDAANEYSKYPLENYQLDFYVDSSWDWLPWNWLDGIGKSIQYGLYAITNFVWTVSMYIQCHWICGTGNLQAGLYLGYRQCYRQEYPDPCRCDRKRIFYTGILRWVSAAPCTDSRYLCCLYRTSQKRNDKSYPCCRKFSCDISLISVLYCLCTQLHFKNQ